MFSWGTCSWREDVGLSLSSRPALRIQGSSPGQQWVAEWSQPWPPCPQAPQPCQGVWGHLKPCCCHFLCHSCSREGNGQERVIGAAREGCRGNEVALGQPAALIHILAGSCVAPGFPPQLPGARGLSPFTLQGQGGSCGLWRELGAPSVPVFRCQRVLTPFCTFVPRWNVKHVGFVFPGVVPHQDGAGAGRDGWMGAHTLSHCCLPWESCTWMLYLKLSECVVL